MTPDDIDMKRFMDSLLAASEEQADRLAYTIFTILVEGDYTLGVAERALSYVLDQLRNLKKETFSIKDAVVCGSTHLKFISTQIERRPLPPSREGAAVGGYGE